MISLEETDKKMIDFKILFAESDHPGKRKFFKNIVPIVTIQEYPFEGELMKNKVFEVLFSTICKTRSPRI